MNAEENFIELCKLAEGLCNLDEGSLALKSRKHKFAVTRSAVSCVARQVDGTHQTVIAKVLNRDRSLIYHYDKMHRSNYETWILYRKTFDKVFRAYLESEKKKRVFKDVLQMKNHLNHFGVKHSDTCQQIIKIKSEKLELDIILSYKDFYNQLELIKLALKDYKYNIEIK
jgi:hypothetical protein|tara:strand:+ start:76 stop:585 length:510 start_codon:yes stop_codon:yes gene_type:complete